MRDLGILCLLLLPAVAEDAPRHRALVELFTSQGWSSCPAAEEFLGKVDTESAVVLAWHVDYWDYLGWKDTFGSKEATARQKRYAQARGLKGLQTPHLFAANRPVSGSELLGAVREEARKKAPFAIEGSAKLEKGKVSFTGKVKAIGEGPGEGVTVQAVLFARKTETKCTAGENKGKTLVEYYAVVDLSKPVPLADALEKGVSAELKAPEGIADLGVAILVEDASRMETLECAAFPVRTGSASEK